MTETSRTDLAVKTEAGGAATHLHPSTGQGWMVWLQRHASEAPNPVRAGLDRSTQAYAVGRCFFALPDDGVTYAWCRRGRYAVLLYGHLVNREELRRRL